jgi:hypothetical protein
MTVGGMVRRGSGNTLDDLGSRRVTVAALVIACGLAIALTATVSCQRHPEAKNVVEPTPTTAQLWDHSEMRETGEDLRELFEQRRDSIDPGTRETVDENLSLIDRSIGELVSAVESDPENPKLHSLLLRAYRNQVRLLQRAVKLATGAADPPQTESTPEPS